MNYEEFCHIASVCTEQIGQKCSGFFTSSNFEKFKKDETGRIAISGFCLFVKKTVMLTQASIDMRKVDEDSDGFLQPHEIKAYIRGLAQLRGMNVALIDLYSQIAAHRFLFFCDPYRRGKVCINKVLLSKCLQELMDLPQKSVEEEADTELAKNWFSLTSIKRIRDMFIDLDKDANGTLSKKELEEYTKGRLTKIFSERVFDKHVRRSKTGGGNSPEMDFESFLDLLLALENRGTHGGLTYLFHCLDLDGRGHLTAEDIDTLLREIRKKCDDEGKDFILFLKISAENIFDMVKPADPFQITLNDLLHCEQRGKVASMLIDLEGFCDNWRDSVTTENLLQEEPEEE